MGWGASSYPKGTGKGVGIALGAYTSVQLTTWSTASKVNVEWPGNEWKGWFGFDQLL